MTENPGYRSGSFDGLHHQHSDDDDDDDLVDIAGATLDFSGTDDVPPLGSGTVQHLRGRAASCQREKWEIKRVIRKKEVPLE